MVAAAVEVGIENLTMAAVAHRLGTSHQALYRWVRDRDELVALVADVFVRQLEVRAAPDGNWREALRAFAQDLREVLGRIPGFALEGLLAFRTTPAFLELNRQGTAVLADAGFAPDEAQRIYQTTGTVLLGWIAREDAYRGYRAHPELLADEVAQAGDAVARRLGPVQAAALDELTSPAAERYAFLVDVLLRGLPDPVPREDLTHASDAPHDRSEHPRSR